MRPIEVSQVGDGSSDRLVFDTIRNPFQVGFGCVVTGTVAYTVEHTFDNVQDPAVTPVWFPHPDSALVGASTSQDGTYAFPITAARVTVSGGGGGTVRMRAIQAGHRGA